MNIQPIVSLVIAVVTTAALAAEPPARTQPNPCPDERVVADQIGDHFGDESVTVTVCKDPVPFKGLEDFPLGRNTVHAPKTLAARITTTGWQDGTKGDCTSLQPNSDALRIRLSAKDKDEAALFITFLGGCGSESRSFLVYKYKAEKQLSYLGEISAQELWVPGNGSLYSAGHVQAYFDTRRKYKVENGKLEQVAQPFLHVGLVSKTNDAITLWQDQTKTTKIANIPAGEPVEVLVSDPSGDWFVVKTQFGLTGWYKAGGSIYTGIVGLQDSGP